MSTKGKMKKLVRLIIISLVLALFMIPANTQVVLADTEVTIQPSAADAYMNKEVPDTNDGTATYLYVRSYSNKNERTILKFDMSSLPDNATVTSATLSLYCLGTASANGRTHYAYRVTQTAWTEGGVTWNKYNGTNYWATAGGDYATADGVSAAVPDGNSWVDWTGEGMKNQVQYALNNTGKVAHFLIKDGTENSVTQQIVYYYSKEYATATLRPKLVVTYTIVSAVAPTVTTQDADGITTTSATLHGNVTDTGGENPTRYFDWGTSPGTYTHTEDCGVGGTGAYEKQITGLTAGQTYYFRARAVNSGGTGTGSEKSFTTPSQATFQPSNADAYIQQANPNTNYGSYDFLCVQSYSGADSNYRSVLSFDMSSLPGNATVTSATLSLYYQASGGNDPAGRTHYAYRVTQTAWTEGGVTWNKYDGTTNWATAGGDYTETNGVSATVPSSELCWVNWTGDGMKNQVQYAIDNTGKVVHFLIKDSVENFGTLYLVGYCSKEYTTVEKRPKLVVEYTAEEPLTVDFSGTPLQGIKGSTLHPPDVDFTDETTSGTTPYTYDWNYGDGSAHGTTANPTHTYSPAGTQKGQEYTVSLTVTDDASDEDTETKVAYVTIYQKGDVNCNLTVNSLDITKIERIVGGADAETFTSDVNDSGGVTSADVTATEVAVAEAWD